MSDKDPTFPEVLALGKLQSWLGKEIPLRKFRLVPYETGHQTPASALLVFSRPDLPEPRGCAIVGDNQMFLELERTSALRLLCAVGAVCAFAGWSAPAFAEDWRAVEVSGLVEQRAPDDSDDQWQPVAV